MYNVVYACLWLAQIHSSTCLLSELIYVAILLQVWKRFVQFEHTYGDLSSMLKVWALFIGFVNLGEVHVNMAGRWLCLRLSLVTAQWNMAFFGSAYLWLKLTGSPYLWFECATPYTVQPVIRSIACLLQVASVPYCFLNIISTSFSPSFSFPFWVLIFSFSLFMFPSLVGIVIFSPENCIFFCPYHTLKIVYSQVEQRRKEALSRTSEDVLSASENTLHDVVSRYSFMDLWPCSSKELDYLVRQEVCAIQHPTYT